MRRLSALVLVVMLVSLLAPAGRAEAATFRTPVAQIPSTPNSSQSVRVWMNSDTAFGETAGLEYNVGSTYVKVLGTYDTSYPGANWRADIPQQPGNTFVQYQLFTRNQFGSDYGFTGFNWNYTVGTQACTGALVGDNNVFYDGLFHDSFAPSYRSPGGPVAQNQGTVTLRFRTCANDVSAVSMRVWNDRSNSESLVPMTFDGNSSDPTLGTLAFWKAQLPIPTTPTVLYYIFRASDGAATGYYRDDNTQFYGGGFGQAEANQGVAEGNSFQLTVYDPAFAVPAWMQRGVVYQIFPDRFRDGNSANNPPAGRFSYGSTTISRSGQSNWNTTVCDPRSIYLPSCANKYGDNFYGGDLAGITEKINSGYFDSLGVSVLYLNPIFRAPSNHKYDTANFLEIDPDFGTLADFQALAAAAEAHGIKLMLDGVFNHTSSDSIYFDRYSRYNGAGNLANPNGGANDGSGACEATDSPYRTWFYFPAGGAPGRDGDPGSGPIVLCAGGQSYEAWYGYSSLPKLQANSAAVRGLIWSNGLNSVGPYWTQQGASGWRFDVGADVDPGVTNDPANDYWEGFRAAVRNPAVTGKSDTLMLGEEWGDASAWLLGNEWDSVMNYRFRSTVLSWLFTGCSGDGCAGGAFSDNDSNSFSSSGTMSYLSPSQFNARLRSIQEDYPPQAFKAMMNLAGSHDTNRLRFLLKKINNNNDSAAVQRMKEWWLFAFTYAGAPTLYYGDEVGLSHDGVFANGKYEDDPYNRTPFPWGDTPGSYSADTSNLLPFARAMASIRHSYPALQDGDVQHGLIIDDANKLYGFARTNGSQTALIALNRDGASHTATFTGLNAAPYNLPNGTVLVDAISGTTATVSGGQVSVTVTPTWGAVLLEQNKIETPAAVGDLQAQVTGANVALRWSPVASDGSGGRELVTRYAIHRSTSPSFTPGSGTLVATVEPPAFGSADGKISYSDAGAASGGYYYLVRAINAAGKYADSTAVAPTKLATSLSVGAASGSYGGSVALQATLTGDNGPLAGKTVAFTLNGTPVGSATTDSGGVASLASASLSGINAGSYTGGVGASFAGDNAYNGSAATADLTVNKATASITLGSLSQTYNGTPQTATATTAPSGLNVSFAYSQGGAPIASPIDAGSYDVVATVNDLNYVGSASDTLVINKATASITLGGLSRTYDGTPQEATATTNPPGLDTVTISYNGAPTAPTAAGSYSVVALLNNPNYQADAATGTLVIGKAQATITLSNLTHGYDGSGKAATATTDPPGLSGVSITYNGASSLPVDVGSYAVVATLTNPNYQANDATDTLTIIAADQTISFAPLAAKTYGDQPFQVSASASSGLPVSFSATGDCSVSGSTVTITGAGSCTVTAAQQGGANYSAAPPVDQTFAIAKAQASLSLSGLSATYDGTAQAATVTTTPPGLSGVSVTYDDLASAPVNAGSYAVVAALANPNYQATDVSGTLVIDKATASITLGNLNQTYDGTAKAATATTTPAGLGVVTITYNGAETAPTNAGSYAVVATLANANYTAANASGTLVIGKASATIALSNLTHTYDGTPKAATATTSPAGLGDITITYNGAATPPVLVGSYNVVASLNNANYQATPATGTLVINAAPTGYTFSGFFQPVDNLPVLNQANAGRAIPVKFSLGGNFGLNIFAAGYPKTQAISCSSSAPVDTIEQTINASSSTLSYDPASGQYTYVWKTDRTWANSCRQLVVRFSDGTEQRANFTFR